MIDTKVSYQIAFETDFATVSYNKESKLVILVWKKNSDSENYRYVFNKTLEFAAENKMAYFVSDITKQKLMSPTDRKWFENTILPQAVELGLKKAAAVYDGNAFKKYYLTNIMNKVKSFSIPFKFFSSVDEAINWLFQ